MGKHYFIGLVIIVVNLSPLVAQSTESLFTLVDSIIHNQLGYVPLQVADVDTVKLDSSSILRSRFSLGVRSFFSPHPEPLIIINGAPFPKSKLGRFKVSDIQHITVHTSSDSISALYGSRASNGLIVIQTNKRYHRKVRRIIRTTPIGFPTSTREP